MNNLTLIDKVQYEKANKVEIKEFQSIKRRVYYLVIIVVMLIYEFVLFLMSLFRPAKPDNIAGQICLISGASNGLGRCLALKFAEQKCKIVIVDILDTQDTVKEIVELYGVDCKGFKCDISDYEAVRNIKHEIESTMGTVDILVNNAGLLFSGTLDSYSIESIEKCVAVNLTSHFTTVKLFLPEMVHRKAGKIVAIASFFAKMPSPMSTVYSATKFGVDGFMEALFDDLCMDDNEVHIRLTTVYPYFINTRKQLGEMMDECEDILPRMTPEYVAEETVKAVLMRKRKLVLTPFWPLILTQRLPDRIIKYLKTTTNKAKAYKEKYYSDGGKKIA